MTEHQLTADEERALRKHVDVARARVTPPAMGIAITAILQAMTACLYLLGAVIAMVAVLGAGSNTSSNDWIVGLVVVVIATLIVLVGGVLPPLIILFGALQMRRLRSYSWAIAAAIMLPAWSVVQLGGASFFGLLCVIALPQAIASLIVGVWALTALQDLRIYRAFLDARELRLDH